MKSYKDIATDGGSNVVAQVTEQANRLQARLASVGHVIAVMSGKGGVGKSAVTVNLASALALEGHAVGILDTDFNGASIAKMMGVRGHPLHPGKTGLLPAVGALGIKVMSIDLFLTDDTTPVLWDAPTQKGAYTWRGMTEMAALRELLSDTEWQALDFLFLDLPPGTDKLPNISGLLPTLAGTLIVTLPSGISQFVVGKSIKMATDLLQTPVIGLIENMSAYICPHCGEATPLFPTGHVVQMAAAHGVPYLGGIPFDAHLAMAADEGALFMQVFSETPTGQAINEIARQVKGFVS